MQLEVARDLAFVQVLRRLHVFRKRSILSQGRSIEPAFYETSARIALFKH